ncbi:MAG: alpha/beta hydrolase [Pyrinomonadaceae bacterium]|nr:alpha/beta hydrolase [Pyrinomonadaceae bacterium]
MRYVLASSFFFVLFAQVFGQSTQPIKLQVNGVELHYIEKGQGEALILIHGGIGDYRSWNSQLQAFAPDYQVISYSRRYHYPNQNALLATNHSALIEAKDLAAFLKKLKFKRVHLVGQSYGALTALFFAIKHPEMVRTLVLGEPPAHQLIRNSSDGEAIYQNFMTNTWKPAAEAFRKGEDKRALDVLALGIAGKGFNELPPAAQASQLENALSMKSLTLSSNPFSVVTSDELTRLKVPVLILTGENTTRIHRRVTQELARLIPKAKEVTIPRSSHPMPSDNPQVFNETVREFLRASKR